MRFSHGHGTGEDWRAALDACVESLGVSLASQTCPDGYEQLGIVFATDAAAGQLANVVAHLREATGVAKWTGTLGIGICSTGREFFDEPAVVAMVCVLPRGAFQAFALSEGQQTPDFGAAEDWCDAGGPAFALVHASPKASDLTERLADFAGSLTTGFVVGGITSSRGGNDLADASGSDIAGVAFDASVGVSTRLTQGCSPIGPRRRITRGERNVLFELDDRPALEALKEDIGELLARDLRRVGGLIFAALPVRGSDTGDYVVRNLVSIDPGDGAVGIGELVTENNEIMFCRRDQHSAEQDLRRMVGELKSGLTAEPSGAVYYSCLARGPNLFGNNSEELKIIADILGDVPLVGFFGNGEISHDRLYAYTGVLTVFT